MRGLSACLLFGSAWLPADDTATSDSGLANLLAAGSVTAESVRTDESGGAARFQIYIQAPVESIWNTVFSCEKAFVFVKGLRRCEVLERNVNDMLTRQVVKTSWLVPAQDFTFRTHREPYRRAEFFRTEGSPRELEGGWEFDPLDRGVVVTHELRIRTGFPVPRFLIRSVMRNNMPDMLRCIRGLSKGSLDADQAAADLASCPGAPE
jgi:ribosome-associated toxin RatA of RatAB toxin-antitoxin module